VEAAGKRSGGSLADMTPPRQSQNGSAAASTRQGGYFFFLAGHGQPGKVRRWCREVESEMFDGTHSSPPYGLGDGAGERASERAREHPGLGKRAALVVVTCSVLWD
jgi:hypothetical protein